MAVWPTSLPAPALNSVNETAPDNTIRSNVDRGPAILRRRTTANTRPISFSMVLTPAQTQILDDFYVEDTFSGAVSFNYTHPRTLQPVIARFVDKPTYSEVEGVAWNASVSLEIMP
jgi:hypothetical protein